MLINLSIYSSVIKPISSCRSIWKCIDQFNADDRLHHNIITINEPQNIIIVLFDIEYYMKMFILNKT